MATILFLSEWLLAVTIALLRGTIAFRTWLSKLERATDVTITVVQVTLVTLVLGGWLYVLNSFHKDKIALATFGALLAIVSLSKLRQFWVTFVGLIPFIAIVFAVGGSKLPNNWWPLLDIGLVLCFFLVTNFYRYLGQSFDASKQAWLFVFLLSFRVLRELDGFAAVQHMVVSGVSLCALWFIFIQRKA